MEKEQLQFKFEPIYVTILFLITLITTFACYAGYNGPSTLWLILWPFFIGWIALPKFLCMIRGIPAIALTNDCLIDNTGGFYIEWSDILKINIAKASRGSGLIVISLNQSEKYFNTPLKKFFYKLRKLYSKHDVVIHLDLVAGKNEQILQTILSYWATHNKSLTN